MATIRDVARRAGVGTGTVSRVINRPHSVSEVTRRAVEAAIAALDYRPSHTAQSLSMGRTMAIALIIPDITNPFFPQLTRGVSDAARAAGYSVLLANTDGDPAEERASLEQLGRRVDGVLLAPTTTEPPDPLPPVPLVLVDRRWAAAVVDNVTVDNRAAMRDMVRRLVAWGHRRILFLGGPRGIHTADDRLAGYREALRGVSGADMRHVTHGPFSLESGYDRTRKALERGWRPTAVVGANDLLAAGALHALRDGGQRVPEDVSVTGFDNLPLLPVLQPSLTSVDQSTYELGREGVLLLLARLGGDVADPHAKRLPATIVLRESTGPAPD